MGVPAGSMTLAELSEAIPPSYSRHVAESFLAWRAQTPAGRGFKAPGPASGDLEDMIGQPGVP